jgi:hypothetical protein
MLHNHQSSNRVVPLTTLALALFGLISAGIPPFTTSASRLGSSNAARPFDSSNSAIANGRAERVQSLRLTRPRLEQPH